jgi:LemA protein
MTATYVVIGVVALVVLWAVLTYNGLVRARLKAGEAWSGIDVQLRRRHDLIPNLVETVKGYATHERGTFDSVTEARAKAMAASGPAEQSKAESSLSASLGNLRAVAEQYPALRASDNFMALQAQLTEIEDELQAARRIYNSDVQIYNEQIQVFPSSIVAGLTRFTEREFFEIEDPAERAVPAVSFS